VLAVADAYLTARQVRHLHAVAVGETQGVLHPVPVAGAPGPGVAGEAVGRGKPPCPPELISPGGRGACLPCYQGMVVNQ
jgi:hypothetical protein